MTIPSWILPLFEGEEVTALAKGRLHRWQGWVLPIRPEEPIGDDVAYEDDFEAIKTELGKLSGTDLALIEAAAEHLLKTGAKDLRVAVYYTYARFRQKGGEGLSDGLELICSLLKAYPQDIWPKRPAQRCSALAWLASEKMVDSVSAADWSNRDTLKQTLSALVLLNHLLLEQEEAFRPNLSPLLQQFEQTLSELSYQAPVAETPVNLPQVNLQEALSTPQTPTPISAINSSKMLLDQTRVMAAYLRQQDNGYWAAYKMVRAIRWGVINSSPPSINGQTRLKPPRVDLQTTLKRLIAEKQWLDLLERVDTAFLEGANQYWLDLQYYAWLGQKALGGLYADQADSALGELGILLTRCPELSSLSFEDGSPFVSDSVVEWLQNQVSTSAPSLDKTVNIQTAGSQTIETSEAAIEQEATNLLAEKGLEAAIGWLDGHPRLQQGKLGCYKWLLMAKLAEKQQKNDWAVYLLEQSISSMQRSSVSEWDKDFSFENHAMLYRLLYAKSKRKDIQADSTSIQMQLDQLREKLMQIDAVRALYLFH